jgi:hypothetical protein
MYTGLTHLHNTLRWIILILLLVAIFRHLSGMTNKRMINNGDKKVDLFLMISAHITLLIGLYQWIFGALGLKAIQQFGFDVVMHSAGYRFFAIEHITGMLIAIILITIGRGKVKRSSDASAHKKAFWLFLLALILIFVSIPWPFRGVEIARPLFPGMK